MTELATMDFHPQPQPGEARPWAFPAPERGILDNGLTGTNKINFQVDCQIAAFTESVPDGTKAAVEYGNTFMAVLNTTNAGGSGGYSPIKVSVTNNVPAGTF